MSIKHKGRGTHGIGGTAWRLISTSAAVLATLYLAVAAVGGSLLAAVFLFFIGCKFGRDAHTCSPTLTAPVVSSPVPSVAESQRKTDELMRILAGERRRCRAAVRRIDRSLIALRGHLTLPDGEGVIAVTPGGVAMLGTPLLPAAEIGRGMK